MSLFAFVSQPWNAAAAAVYPVRAAFPVGSSSSCCMEGAANCSPPLHLQRVLLIAPPLHFQRSTCSFASGLRGEVGPEWFYELTKWSAGCRRCRQRPHLIIVITLINQHRRSYDLLTLGWRYSAACAVARLRQFGQLVRQLSDYSSGPSDVYTFVLWLFGSPKAFWSV